MNIQSNYEVYQALDLNRLKFTVIKLHHLLVFFFND